MKKSRLMIFCFLVLITTTKILALENKNIPQPVLNRIKSLGIDVKNAEFAELEPNEFTTYDSYSKKEYSNQKNDQFYWSTIWHNNLSSLNFTVNSTSTLNGYPVSNLFDKKLDTAWVEGIQGAGIGEMISVILNTRVGKANIDRASGLFHFGIIPGYLKNDKTWSENNRIKTALLIIERQRYSEKGDYKDYAILRLNCKDTKKLQVFNIQSYDNSIRSNIKVWLIIENIYKAFL